MNNPAWKRIAWWTVFVCGLGGAYAFGQMNARWYREPMAKLDYTTSVEVIGDAVGRKCYGVVVYRNRVNHEVVEAAVSLGPVVCNQDGGAK